jgi:hypothetical protein
MAIAHKRPTSTRKDREMPTTAQAVPSPDEPDEWAEECCAGRLVDGSPIEVHVDDCPVYRQNIEAINEHHRLKNEPCGDQCDPAFCVHMYDRHFPGVAW